MGRYLNIQLKEKFCTQEILTRINRDLMENYDCPSINECVPTVFNTLDNITDEVEYLNKDAEGLKMHLHLARPLPPETLQAQFATWLNYGYVQIKLSGGLNEREAKAALALVHWAEDNDEKIDYSKSNIDDKETVKIYCAGVLNPTPTARVLDELELIQLNQIFDVQNITKIGGQFYELNGTIFARLSEGLDTTVLMQAAANLTATIGGKKIIPNITRYLIWYEIAHERSSLPMF